MNIPELIRENNRIYNQLSDAQFETYMANMKVNTAVEVMQTFIEVIKMMTPAYVAARKAEALKASWKKTRTNPKFTNWAFLSRFSVSADGLVYEVRPQARNRNKSRTINYDGETGLETSWTETSDAYAEISFRLPVYGRIFLTGRVTHTETFDIQTGRHNFVNSVVFDLSINDEVRVVRVENRSMAHEMMGIGVCEHPSSTALTLNPLYYCTECKVWHGLNEISSVEVSIG